MGAGEPDRGESMHRYARYWGEDDGTREERDERRRYGERGSCGSDPGRWRALRRGEPLPRGWREPHESEWREPLPSYRDGYGAQAMHGPARRVERHWRGSGWERAPYAYGRPPRMMYGPFREPMRGRWEPGPHAGKGPKNYRRSDERIHEDVCDRIATWGWVDASDVEVRVEKGEVTLSGYVASRRDKRLLEDMIETIAGVVDIHNRVRVRRGDEPSMHERMNEREPRT